MMGHNIIKLVGTVINSKDDNLKLLVYKVSTIFFLKFNHFFFKVQPIFPQQVAVIKPPSGSNRVTKWSLKVDRLKLGGKAYLFTVPIHFACQQLHTIQKTHPNSAR